MKPFKRNGWIWVEDIPVCLETHTGKTADEHLQTYIYDQEQYIDRLQRSLSLIKSKREQYRSEEIFQEKKQLKSVKNTRKSSKK